MKNFWISGYKKRGKNVYYIEVIKNAPENTVTPTTVSIRVAQIILPCPKIEGIFPQYAINW